MGFKFYLSIVFAFIINYSIALYPYESETRETKLLDGVWNFRITPNDENQNIGFDNKWYSKPLQSSGDVIPMPVPSSYNDITQSREIRDFSGWVWYDRSFYVTDQWKSDHTIFLRFGSVHYKAIVYINGVHVMNHTGGHLPFETTVTDILKYGKDNLITVAVNNVLSKETIPQGEVHYMKDTNLYPKGFYETSTHFDFFNYAGIHRSVHLYAVPKVHINDITIKTSIQNSTTGVIDYTVSFKDFSAHKVDNVQCQVTVYDKDNVEIKTSKGFTSSISIANAKLWWPFTMNSNPAYLYTLKINLQKDGLNLDSYYLKVGIRTVRVTQTSFLINEKPFYFRGFGKHEDANIRGKGLDLPLILKDFNLIKWIGANSFRTSHYPYSEELMDQADAQGIVVIDECPAVGLISFDSTLLKQHQQTITELINRDKNRPSVVMWSIANEPKSAESAAEDYFRKVSSHAKDLDKTRPISAAINQQYNNDKMAQFLDVIMVNRYYAWYSDTGYSQVIYKHIIDNFEKWHSHFKKPVMISEYGADTIPGLHMDPPFVFSEDYQTEYLMEHHKAFDKLKSNGYFVGELIWNFADFMTREEIKRVIGNKKGIFTRERQPKAAARVLRCRYWQLAGELTKEAAKDSNFYCMPK